MKSNQNTTSELTFLFKLMPVMHEVESIDRVQRFLLAVVTACRNVGYRRAVIAVIDQRNGLLRGRYGVERAEAAPSEHHKRNFEEMARGVFEVFENVEQTDLTLSARAFSVSLEQNQSALVKALRTSYPVLADRGLSEFAEDNFFDLIGSNSYVAVPLRVGSRITAILAVDRGDETRSDEAEDISLLYSLTQQASEALTNLSADSEHKRRLRIVWKLQHELGKASNEEEVQAAMQIGLLMVGRSVDGDGCMVKDYTRQKTLHVKAAREYTKSAGDIDVAISECFDDILDRCAGRMQAIEGTSEHPMLTPLVAKHIDSFYISPLVSGDEVAGALGVYKEGATGTVLTGDQKRFIDMCGGIIAAKLDVTQKDERFKRAEACFEEVTGNLSRERENSRIGEHSIEYHGKVSDSLEEIDRLLSSRTPYAKRVPKIAERVRDLQAYARSFERLVLAPRSSYRMADIFGLVEGVVEVWQEGTDLTDIDLTVRIPDERPKMLVDKKRIALALASILGTTSSYLRPGDKLLVECSTKDERVHICFADTGDGLPGDSISRLFLPFERDEGLSDTKRALSLAAGVIEKHAGDVMIKSSGQWKTILILSFPLASNKDRRHIDDDRRRRGDRREPVPTR